MAYINEKKVLNVVKTVAVESDDVVLHTGNQLKDKQGNNIFPNIDDNSITFNKTDFIVTGKNLFNKNKIESGKFIYYATGTVSSNAQFWVSDYVKIDNTLEYITVSPTNGYQLCFFDSTKTFISGAYYGDTPSGVIAIPNNAKYIRFSDDLARLNVFQIEYGQNKTSYENYYNDFKYSNPSIISRKQYKISNVTELIAYFKEAYNLGNCDLYISKGTYDISNVSLVTTIFNMYGLRLGKNNKYYFEEGSKIVCNYTGSDDDILKNFSVFTSLQGDGSFELNNCCIECSKIRYAVHDENGGTNTTAYTHKYINCNFEYDNTNNPYIVNYNMTIGGGLGTYATIIFENCIFNNISNGVDVSYHGNYDNTMTQGIQKVIVTGCYFSTKFQMANPNYETANKTFIYSNNSSSVAVRVEDATKVDSYIFNNEIRN